MTVGSLFAGIGGFDLGFERAGFTVGWQVEQDAKAQDVLRRRFPATRLYDDVQTVGLANLEPVDVICGGFPCQDVSVAGKREGLGGVRTGLFWEVVRIARELQPRWMVLENVPGLLSSHGGRDFHAVLSALAECGFRRAYRILDSRYFGVAQRRRRVFLVLRARGCGDGAEQVLFESPRGQGDSQTGDEAGSDVAATLRGRSHGAGVNMPGRGGEDDQNLVYALRSNERNTSQGPGNYIPAVARALTGSMFKGHDDDTDTLIPAFQETGHGWFSQSDCAATLRTPDGGGSHIANTVKQSSGVRRLTPLECERLQGFPDGWTCLCGHGHLGSRYCTYCSR